MNLKSLSEKEFCELLKIKKEDIDALAPRNTDGTINLVEYAAWLAKEVIESERKSAEAD